MDDRGRSVGASSRTLARCFQRETGLPFGRWRQRLRILSAIPKLAAGDSVTRVAYDLAYRGPSAFIEVFRRAFGQPPARFARARREH
ncbi:MAG: helix-turn-helix domain-containing protein [Gammaproteobacteria bacterium]|nr:helix-turn-helix domain-containing protein [Gammaproteobacteria bacterium]MDH3464700.1 helix-turn-helix domain-containing protein [Gammaproteobacteria bacterium]